MKNSKAIIAVLCAVVLIFSLAACAQQKAKTESVTQAVTNENGEIVTDKNGAAVTEELQAQIVTDAEGKAITEVVTGTDGKPLTTVKDNKYVNVTQVVTAKNSNAPSGNATGSTTVKTSTTKASKDKKTTKSEKASSTTKKSTSKVKAPEAITKLKASDVTQTSFKLSWNKVDCTGYRIMFSTDGGARWSYFERKYSKTSYTANGLISDTNYIVKVVAYNSKSGKTAEGKGKQVAVKTKANTKSRKIKIHIVLPIDSNMEDTLTIFIDGKEIKKEKVRLDGSAYTFTTDEKYKGEVEIRAELKEHGAEILLTDKEECTIEVPLGKIPILIDDED